MKQLTPGQKAARTKKRRKAALKAVRTRRHLSAFAKARAEEAASKEALRAYCQERKWKIAFFEGASGAPRTGIIDAIAFRLGRTNADTLQVRLVQLKGGKAGVSGAEIARLKKAASVADVKWVIAVTMARPCTFCPRIQRSDFPPTLEETAYVHLRGPGRR
jgi:hypothetical protein